MIKCRTGIVSSLLFFIYAGVVLSCDVDTEYKCASGRCIPLSSYNNSFNDCGDNSDEVISPCRYPMFSCLDGVRCILQEWVLNGVVNCLDNSDEAKLIGERCDPAQTCCFCHDYVTHSECVDQVCRCQAGYYSNQLGNGCLPRLMGSPCNQTSECHEVNWFSHCDDIDHVCVCDKGRHPADDRRLCEELPPTVEVTVVAVCVIVICLLVIVNTFLVLWICRAFVCVEHGLRRPANVPELFAVMGYRQAHKDALIADNTST